MAPLFLGIRKPMNHDDGQALSESWREPAVLAPQENEHLPGVIEACLRVRQRSQFFLWAQGELQRLLPHEILLCALADPARRDYLVESFSRAPLPTPLEALVEGGRGLLFRLMNLWLDGGHEPMFVTPGERIASALGSQLVAAGLDSVAAHGMHGLDGAPASYFVFARLPCSPGARHAFILQLLVPHLHAALTRILAGARRRAAATAPFAERLISEREAQILEWVQRGKSNHEIGQILDISPLTVKNHVQNILRKLDVHNRAEAVAKAASLRILKPLVDL